MQEAGFNACLQEGANVQRGQRASASLGHMEHDEAKVEGLSSEQLVALSRIQQWKRLVGALHGSLREFMLVQPGVHLQVPERALQDHVVDAHGIRSLALEHEMVAESSLARLCWVPLIVIHTRLHHPL